MEKNGRLSLFFGGSKEADGCQVNNEKNIIFIESDICNIRGTQIQDAALIGTHDPWIGWINSERPSILPETCKLCLKSTKHRLKK